MADRINFDDLEFKVSILKGVAGGLCTAAAAVYIINEMSGGNEIYRLAGGAVAVTAGTFCLCTFAYLANKELSLIGREEDYRPPKRTSNFDP